MENNTQHTAIRFYQAFQQLNAQKMAACYHSTASFYDPAFGKLSGEDIGHMWNMLISSQKNKEFTITYTPIRLDEEHAEIAWEAIYYFSKTGRKVHNKIMAKIELKDGLIYNHVDFFDLYVWSRQALGITGWVIGWTPFFRSKMNRQTIQLLHNWKQKNISK